MQSFVKMAVLALLVLALFPTTLAAGTGDQSPIGAPAADRAAILTARDLAEQCLANTAAYPAQATQEESSAAARNLQTDADEGALRPDRRLAALSLRSLRPPAQARVPILMYHHIATPPPGADAVRRDLSVSPAAFREQLRWLSDNGYTTISLTDLANHLQKGWPLPSRPVILTFDDGYDDNYLNAQPLLLAHGFRGTFFVLTDAVGAPGYMTWEQIIEMSRNGMSIEAHGRTHADLAISSDDNAVWQIASSKAIIEEKVGQAVSFFCYPSGRYTARTTRIVKAAGYQGAVSTAYGASHSQAQLMELARVRVRGSDTLDQFIAKLTTAP